MKYLLFLLLVLGLCGLTSACHFGASGDVLVITDIGIDVDDAEAICLLAGEPGFRISGVACTGAGQKVRLQKAKYLLSLLGREDVPVGRGPFFIDSVIRSTRGKCDILLIAQATSLSAALENNPGIVRKIGRIYFQGQAVADSNGRLLPNPEAYNVSEDIAAAESLFAVQDKVPFTVVGKYAAYSLPVSRETFDGYENSGHPAGAWLKKTALESISDFSKNAPEKFRKVYNIPEDVSVEDGLASLENISNPYDAVTVLSMTMPECFEPIKIHHHSLIGVTEGKTEIISSKCNILQCRIRTLFLSLRPEKNSLTTNNNL